MADLDRLSQFALDHGIRAIDNQIRLSEELDDRSEFSLKLLLAVAGAIVVATSWLVSRHVLLKSLLAILGFGLVGVLIVASGVFMVMGYTNILKSRNYTIGIKASTLREVIDEAVRKGSDDFYPVFVRHALDAIQGYYDSNTAILKRNLSYLNVGLLLLLVAVFIYVGIALSSVDWASIWPQERS